MALSVTEHGSSVCTPHVQPPCSVAQLLYSAAHVGRGHSAHYGGKRRGRGAETQTHAPSRAGGAGAQQQARPPRPEGRQQARPRVPQRPMRGAPRGLVGAEAEPTKGAAPRGAAQRHARAARAHGAPCWRVSAWARRRCVGSSARARQCMGSAASVQRLCRVSAWARTFRRRRSLARTWGLNGGLGRGVGASHGMGCGQAGGALSAGRVRTRAARLRARACAGLTLAAP